MNKSLYKTGRKEIDKAMNENLKKEKTTKKLLTLHDLHMARFSSMVALFVAEIFEIITDYANFGKATVFKVLDYAALIAALILAVRWAYVVILKRPVEVEDELAKENMVKAHEKIGLVFWIILGVVLISTIFWNGSITIKLNSDLVNNIWFIIFSAYFAMESGFFIYYDRTAAGDDCDDDDDDEESAGDE